MGVTHISQAIKNLFKDNQLLQNNYHLHKVTELVNQKLGDFFIQKGVKVKSIKFKTLYIVCDNAVLKSELQIRNKLLITHINQEMQEEVIDEIVLLNE